MPPNVGIEECKPSNASSESGNRRFFDTGKVRQDAGATWGKAVRALSRRINLLDARAQPSEARDSFRRNHWTQALPDAIDLALPVAAPRNQRAFSIFPW